MRILEDFKFYRKESLSKSVFAVLINPCFHCLLLYRVSHMLYRNKLTIIAKCIWFINRIIYNVDIDYRSIIGKNVIIIHGIGIVIGHKVIIEDNVKIYQGVTLGGNNNKNIIYNGEEITQPIIKSGSILSPNSMIFGPIIVKENSFIKAGEIVS